MAVQSDPVRLLPFPPSGVPTGVPPATSPSSVLGPATPTSLGSAPLGLGLSSPPTSVSTTSVVPSTIAALPPLLNPSLQPVATPAMVPLYPPKAVSMSSNPYTPAVAPYPITIKPPPSPPQNTANPGQPASRTWGRKWYLSPADLHSRLLVTFPPCPPTLKVLRPIGQGHYATVFEAMDEFPTPAGQRERRVCAVKRIQVTENWTVFEALRLQEAQHLPNVIECPACYYESQRREIWIVMERMDGSVLDILQSGYPITEAMIADIARQTLRALRGLHDMNLVHMDVKPANILYRRLSGQRMEYKLSDFGCVQDQRHKETDELGEFTYMSPEVMLHKVRTTRTDIWNLGISLLHLADREPPLNGWDEADLRRVSRTTLCPQLREPQRWSPELADFISKCLVKDFRFRPDAATLLRHPLFLCHRVK
eukprot:GGOE01053958.1.p1 GENE.GGOE01053958.1~~GGOE01053958.1.p1  ORF type:complete len:424 (+),score=121.12 GGOE01053958.1:191-1462(+)